MTTNKKTILALIARLGFLAKGLVYFMVGLLAFQTTIGMGGGSSSTTQALQEFIYQPFGSVLLIGCAFGLLAHAVWRIIQALIDPDDRGTEATTLFFRAIDFIVGCLYLSFSYAAWQIFKGLQTKSSSESTEVWISKILNLPFGKWLVIFCALVVLIIAGYQFYSAYVANFDYSFDIQSMSKKEQQTLRLMGRIGFSAWGIVYSMMAILFYQAAVNYDASEAGGLSDALNALQKQPYGIWILGITAGGLIVYGLYLLILSYYHRIYR